MLVEQIINLSSDASRDRLLTQIRHLTGIYRVRIVKYRRRRSDAQNRYLWAVVYPVLAQGISEAWGETLSPEQAHEWAKVEFLSRPLIDHATGESHGFVVGHTPPLNTKEFSEYVEKIIRFAAETLGVLVPAANPFEIGVDHGRPSPKS